MGKTCGKKRRTEVGEGGHPHWEIAIRGEGKAQSAERKKKRTEEEAKGNESKRT